MGLKRVTVFDRAYSLVTGLFLLLFCLCIFYPLYYMLIVSVSHGNAVIRGEVSLYPVGINFRAYKAVFDDPNILRSYGNTIRYTALGTAINLVMSVLCAFPLSRGYFYGRRFFSMMIVFTMLFDAGIVSNFLIVQRLGLIDTIWAVVLPPAISAYNMIIIRTFFQQLPEELFESAYMDGATDFTALLRIALPLSKPVLATMFLFYAVSHWNSFLPALLYLNDRALYPMQLVMRNIVISGDLGSMRQTLASMSGDTSVIGANIKYAVIFITMLFVHIDNCTFITSVFNPAIREVKPDAYFDIVPPVSYDGTEIRSFRFARDWNVFTSVSSKVARPADIVRFLSWMYTEEGANLTNFGVEDVTYEIKDGTITMLPELYDRFKGQEDPYGKLRSEYGLGMTAYAKYIDESFNAQMSDPIFVENGDKIDAWTDQGHVSFMPSFPAFTEEEAEILKNLETQIGSMFNQEIDKFIMGTRPLSEYDRFMEDLRALGVADLEKVFNDAQARLE